MEPQIIQNLRYKLQKRVRRLNSVRPDMFIMGLRQFWVFFEKNQTYSGIMQLLLAKFPDLTQDVEKIFDGQNIIGETEEESAALGYSVLKRAAQLENSSDLFHLAYHYGEPDNMQEAVEIFRDTFLEPFYEYVDETLDDERAMLALLLRYKHRCEWFRRKLLWEIVQENTQKGEKLLALDLYSYLYDQGLEFNIEPSSITGAIDLIAAQGSSDPLLADAKIFDGQSRSKTYIRKAFNQIYTYCQQFNESFGYLVIYKITDRDLHLSLRALSRDVPMLVYNHKTIFILTIDIYLHSKSVSQRDPLEAIQINENELVTAIEESESESVDPARQ